MVLKLRITQADHVTEKRISRFPCAIGRSMDAAIQLDDRSVSSLHALIERVDQSLILTDQQSTNGTFVGNEKKKSFALTDQTTFRIGATEFTVLSIDEWDQLEEIGGPHINQTAEFEIDLENDVLTPILPQTSPKAPTNVPPPMPRRVTSGPSNSEAKIELDQTRRSARGNSPQPPVFTKIPKKDPFKSIRLRKQAGGTALVLFALSYIVAIYGYPVGLAIMALLMQVISLGVGATLCVVLSKAIGQNKSPLKTEVVEMFFTLLLGIWTLTAWFDFRAFWLLNSGYSSFTYLCVPLLQILVEGLALWTFFGAFLSQASKKSQLFATLLALGAVIAVQQSLIKTDQSGSYRFTSADISFLYTDFHENPTHSTQAFEQNLASDLQKASDAVASR